MEVEAVAVAVAVAVAEEKKKENLHNLKYYFQIKNFNYYLINIHLK